MVKGSYLTNLNDIFAKDLQDPIFTNDFKNETEKLISVVVVYNSLSSKHKSKI